MFPIIIVTSVKIQKCYELTSLHQMIIFKMIKLLIFMRVIIHISPIWPSYLLNESSSGTKYQSFPDNLCLHVLLID